MGPRRGDRVPQTSRLYLPLWDRRQIALWATHLTYGAPKGRPGLPDFSIRLTPMGPPTDCPLGHSPHMGPQKGDRGFRTSRYALPLWGRLQTALWATHLTYGAPEGRPGLPDFSIRLTPMGPPTDCPLGHSPHLWGPTRATGASRLLHTPYPYGAVNSLPSGPFTSPACCFATQPFTACCSPTPEPCADYHSFLLLEPVSYLALKAFYQRSGGGGSSGGMAAGAAAVEAAAAVADPAATGAEGYAQHAHQGPPAWDSP
jgi:hypothetical protein